MNRPDTGEVHRDLPPPYIPHACGLLHLPRFIAKAKKSVKGELGKSYQRNYKKGFDRFLCLHIGIEPEQVEEIVRSSADDAETATVARLHELAEPLDFDDLSELERAQGWKGVESRLRLPDC